MEVKLGYKWTDVGAIPNDWAPGLLGDCAAKIGSGITPTGGIRVYRREGRPFLRSQNVGWGDLLLDDVAFIDEETHSTFSGTEIVPGDVFLNITGASIGRSAVADDRVKGGNVNQHVCIIRPKPRTLDPRFLNAYLLSTSGQRQIDNFQAGGNRQGLNFGQIRSFRLPIPPFTEQEAIANALLAIDALVTSLDRLIAKKRDLKQAAMQQLLTGKRRLPGFNSNWELTPLEEGISLISGRHVLAQHCNVEGRGIPYLTGPADFPNGVIHQTKYTERPGTVCLKDDILVTVKGSGAGSIVMADKSYCISRQLMAMRVKDWNHTFLFYALLREVPHMESASTGLIPGLSRADLLRKTLSIPEINEQTAIAAVLVDMDAEIATLEKKRDKTRDLKHGMMQELLAGRTRLV